MPRAKVCRDLRRRRDLMSPQRLSVPLTAGPAGHACKTQTPFTLMALRSAALTRARNFTAPPRMDLCTVRMFFHSADCPVCMLAPAAAKCMPRMTRYRLGLSIQHSRLARTACRPAKPALKPNLPPSGSAAAFGRVSDTKRRVSGRRDVMPVPAETYTSLGLTVCGLVISCPPSGSAGLGSALNKLLTRFSLASCVRFGICGWVVPDHCLLAEVGFSP